jgi:Uma2 family endonuclease
LLSARHLAESSLAYDHDKLRIYARAGMREVWIVDLLGESVEIYRAPRGDEYRDVRIARRGESVVCLAFPDVALAVDDVLG